MYIIYYDLGRNSYSTQPYQDSRWAIGFVAELREKQRLASAPSEIYVGRRELRDYQMHLRCITYLPRTVFDERYEGGPFTMTHGKRFITFANHKRRCIEVRIRSEVCTVELLERIRTHKNTWGEHFATIWDNVIPAKWLGLEEDDSVFECLEESAATENVLPAEQSH